MSKVILAWELGGNFGHISVLLPLARHLRKRGHEILFVVKDTRIASQLLNDDDFAFMQAPIAHMPLKCRHNPISFADILAQCGFGDSAVLAGLVLAWRNLFRLLRPDSLVAEYSPVAQFAARLCGIPCLQLNSGFYSPPDVIPFPCFRPWLRPTKKQLLQRESALLKNINAVSAQHDFPSFLNVQNAMKGNIDLLATFPELDHYQRRENGYFIGPLPIVDDGIEMQWSEKKAPRIFIYLRPGPETPTILEMLKKIDADVIACIPGIDNKLITSLASEHQRIFTDRVKLSGILTRMDLAITHATHGTSTTMLLAGVPMLTIPTNIEQLMLSGNLERLGIGIEVKRDRVPNEFAGALDRLLSDGNFSNKAKGLAKKYAGHKGGQVVERLANTIVRLPEMAS